MSTAETSTNVATLPAPRQQVVTVTQDIFATTESFEHAQRVAKVFSESALVPQHFRGKLADCILAYQIARRLGEEPLTVMQNIFIVGGRPGWYTSYLIARAKRCGVFRGPISWTRKGDGDALEVTARATLVETGEVVEASVDMRMAKAEQWTKNSKYQSMPEHMLRWRSAAMLIRLYAPEIMLGIPTVEEIEVPQASPGPRDVTPRSSSLADKLDALAAPREPEPAHDPETGEIIDATGAEDASEDAPANGPAVAPKGAEEAHPRQSAQKAAAGQSEETAPAAAATEEDTRTAEERLLDAARAKSLEGRRAFDAWFNRLRPEQIDALNPHMRELMAAAKQADGRA
jgi:hypothetical protein